MAFLARLICCGAAGKVKYDGGESTTRLKNAKEKQQRKPRRKLKSGAKTAPASGAGESTACRPGSEMTRSSRVASIVIEEIPCSPTPPSTRHKSYSSVSSVGRKLVEKLADEVVEDFMEYDLIDPCPESYRFQERTKQQSHVQQQGCIHFTTQADTSVQEVTRGTVQKQHPKQHCDNKETTHFEEDTHIVDSAWETQDRSFMQKRAFFESQTSPEAALMKNSTIKRTTEATVKLTQASDRDKEEEEEEEPELYHRQEAVEEEEEEEEFVQTDADHSHQQWNQPKPLRLTDRSMEMHNKKFNKPLNRVQSGRSWILDVDVDDSLDPAPPMTPSSALDDREDASSFCTEMEREEMRFFKETCVVRKVFRASSIADDEVESSDDGSVISLEVTSCPSDGNEDGYHDGRALGWGYTMNLRKERPTTAAEINTLQ